MGIPNLRLAEGDPGANVSDSEQVWKEPRLVVDRGVADTDAEAAIGCWQWINVAKSHSDLTLTWRPLI
jgi:hypothetical protein